MFNKVKKIFKLSNWKRWAISSISVISMVLAITIGSVYSVNNKPSNDYQSGAQIVLKVDNITGNDNIDLIKRQIEKRLQLTLSPSSDFKVMSLSDDYLTITGTNISTDEELSKFLNFVAPNPESRNKMKPLITLSTDPLKPISNIEFKDSSLSGDKITLDLANPIPFSSIPAESTIYIWKDLPGLLELASSKDFNDEWTSASVNRDPYKFLFIDGIIEETTGGIKPILKTKDFGGFDAIDYLISKNTVPKEGYSKTIDLDFSFDSSITKEQKEKIFYNLDFAISSYTFSNTIYNFIDPNLGNNAWQFLIIASAVAFSFISVFLIVNYGLLGALSTICAAFLIFLGLLMITIFRGDYTPELIAALMISIAIGLDLNIAFFEKMKKELKLGTSLQKANKKANKLTMNSTITKALSLIITAIVIYVVGSLYLGTFSSLVLILSILSVVVLFILIRVLTNLIIGTKIFDNKLKWLGIYKKVETKSSSQVISTQTINMEVEQSIIEQSHEINIKDKSKAILLSKRISLALISIITVVGATLFTIFSITGTAWHDAFNSSGPITNPIIFKTTENVKEVDLDKIKKYLADEMSINEKDINSFLSNNNQKTYSLEVATNQVVDEAHINKINQHLLSTYNVKVINYSVMADQANAAILNIIYVALAVILAMSIFVLIRSDWAYALSMLIALFIAIPLFIILFTFQVFTFNIFFIFALASAILIAVSNNITILFRIKEKFKNKKLEELVKKDIVEISDKAVNDSFRRLLISNGLLMGILLIFSVLPGALLISYTIPLMIFILISLVVSIVIIPFFFNIFKSFKCKRKRDRIINNYWHIQKIEEQVFPEINDIK